MIRRLRQFFSAPDFPNYAEKNRRARLLSVTLNASLAGITLVFLVSVVGGQIPSLVLAFEAVFFVGCLILRLTMNQGHVDLAALSITALLFSLLTANSIQLGTVRTPNVATYILLVVLVGLLFGSRNAIVAIIAVSSLTVIGLTTAELNGWLPEADMTVDISQGIMYAVLFSTAGILTYYALTTVQTLLQRADHELAQRRLAEAALRSSEEQLRAVTDTMQEIVVLVDDKGLVQYANDALRPLFGFRPAEVFGKPATDFIDPDDHQRLTTLFKSLLAKESGQALVEFRGRMANGHQIYIEATAQLLARTGQPAGVVFVLRDVAARRKTEAQLRKLSRAVEASPTSILITDVNGAIEYANPEFTKLTGYGLEETLGQIQGFLNTDLIPSETFRELWQTILAGKTWRGELANRKKNGNIYWEWAVISPILDPDSGQITHFVAVKEDISDRKQVEERLRLSNSDLKQRNDELNAFAYTVAHDLKSPVNLAVGFAELLKEEYDSVLDEDGRQSLRHIIRSSRTAGQIIESLLLLARAGNQEVELVRLPMRLIIGESIKRLSFNIAETDARVTVMDEGSDAWRMALGYWQWVEEVWVNLILNGLKYGGRPPCITLSASDQLDGFVRFNVTDNGRGLTKEQRKRLFVPFERLDQTKTEGHGLGLSIVRRILDKLDGDVGVESEVGQGSTFYFTLPVAPDWPARSSENGPSMVE